MLISVVNNREETILQSLYTEDKIIDRRPISSSAYYWLPDVTEFKNWMGMSSDPSFLWVSAPPWYGKTALVSWLLTYLSWSQRDEVVASHFCDARMPAQVTATSIIRHLLHQLIIQHKQLITHAIQHFQGKGLKGLDHFDALWDIFEQCLFDASLGGAYIILDGLDEC